MNFALLATLRITRTLGIVATVFAMSFVSTGNSYLEECPQEIVSQEAELLLLRQEEDVLDSKLGLARNSAIHQRPKNLLLPLVPVVARVSERDELNGLGTYQLI